jgi:hypothetical protein
MILETAYGNDTYIYNDGGRTEAGFKGDTGDCVTRAIAIATSRPYKEVYDFVNNFAKQSGTHGSKRGRTSARTGVIKTDTKKIMAALGFEWVPLMKIGQGCKTHLKREELPSGTIIVNLSRHVCTVIDGVIHDNHYPAREGTRCVYGYWRVA